MTTRRILRVRDVMHDEVHTIDGLATVSEAVALMRPGTASARSSSRGVTATTRWDWSGSRTSRARRSPKTAP